MSLYMLESHVCKTKNCSCRSSQQINHMPTSRSSQHWQKKPAKPNITKPKPTESQIQPNVSGQLSAKPKETRLPATQRTNVMAPPASKPTGAPFVNQAAPSAITLSDFVTTRKPDGNETDSSQTSHRSDSSRRLRSRRSPPGKKMRHSEETTNNHGRVSGDEMHQ